MTRVYSLLARVARPFSDRLGGRTKTKGYGAITIGKNCPLASRCIVLKKTVLPDYCTASAGSVLSGDYSSIPQYSVLCGNPAKLKFTGVWRGPSDDVCPGQVFL